MAKGISGKSRVAEITADGYRRWSCGRCVTKWRIGMYKNTMGQIKNTTDVWWDVFLWNVSKQLVISCARLHWKGVYQGAHGWAIIGELQLQRKMVQSNDSLRFKLANYNCFRCKVDSNVVFRCCHISRKNMLVQKKILGSACKN